MEGERVIKELSAGQRAYEARRAATAGMSLEKWLTRKAREEKSRTESAAPQAPARAAAPARKPGFFARLLERAERPL
uniref:Uncharacterized protein n=1 Tax=Acidicaldus sp. TaxID=1872105 RepID=A0A8J4M603_9PROT